MARFARVFDRFEAISHRRRARRKHRSHHASRRPGKSRLPRLESLEQRTLLSVGGTGAEHDLISWAPATDQVLTSPAQCPLPVGGLRETTANPVLATSAMPSDDPEGAVPASLTRPEAFTSLPAPAPPAEPEAAPAKGWQTIFSDGFEGAFPGDWSLSGDPTWGDTSYSANTGSWSAYCVDSSVPAPGPYPNNVAAWMVYGPFDLSDATDAKVDFSFRNRSESDYDFFGWYASIDDWDYYGWYTSGDQNSWRAESLDLTDVYTLGNLCGQSQVWLAFIFESDYSYTDIGAFVDDVVISKNTGVDEPNLTPYQPAGWDDAIVVSSQSGTNTDDSPWLTTDTLYVDWAVINDGTVPTAATFYTELYVDSVLEATWYTDPPLEPDWYAFAEDYDLGSLSAGPHTLQIVTDTTGTIPEGNEADNTYTKNITVFDPATLGEIRGSKWNDLDADGLRDAGEPGLEDWTIKLDHGGNGTWDETLQTDPNGDYAFTRLVPGTYVVGEELQTGWEQTYPDAGGAVWPEPELRAQTETIGRRNYQRSTAAIEAPGAQAVPDLPLGKDTVTLYETGFEPAEGFSPGYLGGQAGWNTYVSSTTRPVISTAHPQAGLQHVRIDQDPSLPSGEFVGGFSPDLGPQPAGQYLVSMDVAISGALGADYYVTLQAPSQGLITAMVDFGYEGVIWVVDDPDGNGELDFVDTGVAWNVGPYTNLTIDVDATANTIDYYYGGSLIYSSVAGVFAATSVEQVVLDSDNWNAGDVGDFDNLSIVGEESGQPGGTWTVDLGQGDTATGIDFGNFYDETPGEICGSKWNDLDGDGQRDPNEPGLPDWHIYVDLNQNGQPDAGEPEAWTDENGDYCISVPPGRYTVAEEFQPGWEQTYPTAGGPGEYQIDIDFTPGEFTPAQEAIFTQAADRWAEIIVGDVPDVVTSEGPVDDLLIQASAPYIDGPGGILGQAGPTEVRLPSYLPALGIMQFDSADLAVLEASGQLDEVILHEMAHVIGFGTVWSPLGLITGEGGPNPQFVGTTATSEYNAIFGGAEPSVPVENEGGPGTRDGHWRETVFDNELLTGWLNQGEENPLSRITAGSLEDMSYEVNLDAADPYTPPAKGTVLPKGPADWGRILTLDIEPKLLPVATAPLELAAAGLRPTGATTGKQDATWTVDVGPGETVPGIDFGNHAQIDFGDAPDQPYPTLAINNGAGHVLLDGGPFMGPLVDPDPDGQPTPSADGDDLLDTSDDEDGVILPPFLTPGDPAAPVGIDMRSSPVGGMLNAWLDFNADGDWQDPGEQIFLDEPLTPGVINSLTFAVPAVVASEPIFARFRVSTQGGLSYVGIAPDGEVEDYQLELCEPGAIEGYKWLDLDGNGQWDADEPGLPGWHVYVDLNNNGQWDPGEPDDWTDANGQYLIEGLCPGTYTVAEELQNGWTQTYPAAKGQHNPGLVVVGSRSTAAVVAAGGQSGSTRGATGGFHTIPAAGIAGVGGTATGRTMPDALVVPPEARAEMEAAAWASPPPAGEAPYGATLADGSEYMIGDVWVTAVLLESDGSIDPSTEDWSQAEIDTVKAEIQAGLDWWEEVFQRAPGVSPLHALDFHVDFTYTDNPIPCAYEPINRPQSDEGLWIDEFLGHVGYDDPGNSYFTDLARWNHDQRIANQTHWAFTVFVADSSNDADGEFADDYFAYAYLGGPFAQLTYDNDGWGIEKMSNVLAHETAHVFYALDEYPDSEATYWDHSGYYNTQNLNARNEHPDPTSRVASIMAEYGLQRVAYANRTSSPNSLEMIGWKDSDADGIFDVLDVPLTLSGSGAYNQAAGRYEFSGTSSVQTLNNLNPWPRSGRDITTNTVDRIQYRLDGGPWTDGNTYGGYVESVAQNVPVPPGGMHTIDFRTIFVETGVTSNLWSDSFGQLPGTHSVVVGPGQTVPDVNFGNHAEIDFGDAPDPSYPTLAINNGAGHVLLPGGPFMGALVDPDPNGQPTPAADGDDVLDGSDDEDGVTLPGAWMPGDLAVPVQVDMRFSPVAGLLSAWVDFNADGDWADPGEQIFTDEPLTPGTIYSLTFAVPTTATAEVTYARFRLSTQAGLSYEGLAPDGEVEDYRIEVCSTLYWDGLGDGLWDDPTRWVCPAGTPAGRIPDNDAVVRTDRVTVTGSQTARNLTIESGVLEVAPYATLGLAGELTVDGNGEYQSELNGVRGGLIQASGDARLAGTLSLEATEYFFDLMDMTLYAQPRPPWPGDQTREIITAAPGEVQGEFDHVPDVAIFNPPLGSPVLGHLGYGVFLTDKGGNAQGVTYRQHTVEVDVFQGAPGDTNGDRKVDSRDIQNILAANKFNKTEAELRAEGRWPATWPQGDFNDDGLCSSLDIQMILATNLFNRGLYAPPISPTPGAVGITVTSAGVGMDRTPIAARGPRGSAPIAPAAAHDAVLASAFRRPSPNRQLPPRATAWLHQYDQASLRSRPAQRIRPAAKVVDRLFATRWQ